MIEQNTKGTSGFDRDILEWNIPEEVLAVLLKDRSTGRNLIWATDDYAERGKGFSANDEILIEQIVDKDNPVIRPRVDKSAEEQRQRVVKRAEVFTPSWICNKQNNLVDAAWFGWKKHNSSPFNKELEKFDPDTEFGWQSTCGRQPIKFPGCRKKDNSRHTGMYCKVMDWSAGELVEFRAIAENGGGHGQ